MVHAQMQFFFIPINTKLDFESEEQERHNVSETEHDPITVRNEIFSEHPMKFIKSTYLKGKQDEQLDINKAGSNPI